MFTFQEQFILKNIDKKYSWIAREEDGGLWIFGQKPVKIANGRWRGRPYLEFTMYNDLFCNIQWEDEEPTKIERSEKTGFDELVLRPKVQVIRDIFGDKEWSRLGSEVVTELPSSNNASNHAKRIIDNQVKKGIERYGVGIEECDLSIKELLDNALEENADAMIYLAELRARLFGYENE